jgi:hypothetical protein
VHALVSRGGWTRGWQWVPVPFVDEHAAELLFRHKVIRLLQHEGLLSEERTELLMSWRHTGFSVHTGVRVEPEDEGGLERLSRYILRPPISLERMRWSGRGEVRYRRKGGHDGGPRQPRDATEEFGPADFLARVLMHIPEPRRHLVRYYGAYSNVARGKRKQLQAIQEHESVVVAPKRVAEEQDCSAEARVFRRRWRELIKRVYEVDPLVCPRCHAEMRVIAFIVDHKVVDKILRHLECKAGAACERGPPGEVDLEAAS